MGSSGGNSTPSFYARLVNETLGLKLKLIVGYPGQNDALLAMERGEIDGYPSAFYNSLMATRPNWIPEGKVNLLVQMGAEKEKSLPDTPFIFDLLTREEDRQLWQVAVGPLGILFRGHPRWGSLSSACLINTGGRGHSMETTKATLYAWTFSKVRQTG